MKRYAIKRNKDCTNKILSILLYDENKKEFTIEIPENITSQEAPFLMGLFLEKGIHQINPEWSMKWVKSRIVPSSRQNIGQILREHHMESYDEYLLLLHNQGRSCQDECYIEEL